MCLSVVVQHLGNEERAVTKGALFRTATTQHSQRERGRERERERERYASHHHRRHRFFVRVAFTHAAAGELGHHEPHRIDRRSGLFFVVLVPSTHDPLLSQLTIHRRDISRLLAPKCVLRCSVKFFGTAVRRARDRRSRESRRPSLCSVLFSLPLSFIFSPRRDETSTITLISRQYSTLITEDVNAFPLLPRSVAYVSKANLFCVYTRTCRSV